MKLKGGIAPKTQPVSSSTSAGWPTKRVIRLYGWRVGSDRPVIGSEDRQNMLIYAIAFDFTTSALAPWPRAVPRISDTASHYLPLHG